MITIIQPFERARSIKKKGADIEEILQCYTTDEIREHIKRSVESEKNIQRNYRDNGADNNGSRRNYRGCFDDSNGNRIGDICDLGSSGDYSYPFEILGIGDDNQAYFLNHVNRIRSYPIASISDKILIELGGLDAMKEHTGPEPSKKDWLRVIDSVMQISNNTDFDTSSIRGRGAWRTRSGDICYFDGRNITGTPDPKWSFVRKRPAPVGIGKDECPAEIRSEIFNLTKKFSFQFDVDAERLLSWSCLAPFGGALQWRPAVLVTGESGWGKSTIIDKIVFPISSATRVGGTASTEAGIRQYFGLNSNAILIDEFDAKKRKDKDRLEDILSLMRGATTDDSPMIYKGTIGGSAMNFRINAMFLFGAISAAIDNNADDNRIIKVNFKRPTNRDTYRKDIARIGELLTQINCEGIRSFTWNHLREIIDLGNRLEIIIQKVTGQDSRFAAGESILLSANLIVWQNKTHSLSDDFLIEFVTGFYADHEQEQKREETLEMVDRILDETLILNAESREIRSYRYVLTEMKRYLDWVADGEQYVHDANRRPITISEYNNYKNQIELCGLTVQQKTRELAIVQNHHNIKKILDMGTGYHRQLQRIQGAQKNVAVRVDGRGRSCTVVPLMLEYE